MTVSVLEGDNTLRVRRRYETVCMLRAGMLSICKSVVALLWEAEAAEATPAVVGFGGQENRVPRCLPAATVPVAHASHRDAGKGARPRPPAVSWHWRIAIWTRSAGDNSCLTDGPAQG